MKDDIRVDYQPVTLLRIELGMLQESLGWQHWSESWEFATQETLLEATWDIVSNVSLAQDWSISFWASLINWRLRLTSQDLALGRLSQEAGLRDRNILSRSLENRDGRSRPRRTRRCLYFGCHGYVVDMR